MEDSVSNISTNLESADQEKDQGVWCISSLKPAEPESCSQGLTSKIGPIMLKSSPIILSKTILFYSHSVPNIPILFLWQVT